MAQKEENIKPESNKRTASDCGFTNNDNSPPTKKIKLDNDDNKDLKIRSGTKRKVALIVSYLGTNYHGSAMSGNQSVPTISGQLFKTITKIGAITPQNAVDPKKVSFSASSRTDKGVHAAAATFSLKMINLFEDKQKESFINASQQKKKKKNKDNDDNNNDNNDNQQINKEEEERKKCEYSQWNEMKDLLNKSLPSDIRIQGIQRTTKGFDPRYKAWSRVYHYIIPTFLFDANIKSNDIINLENKYCRYIIGKAKIRRIKKKSKKGNNNNNNNNNNNEEEEDIDIDIDENKNENDEFGMNNDELMEFAKDIFHENVSKNNDEIKLNEKEKDIRFEYRISDELINRLRNLCKMYIGTKNYHNFTRKTHPKEDRAKRYMHSVEIINSSLIVDNVQYLQFEIHGSSFLYHQIRKMIGFMVILMRNTKCKFDDGYITDSQQLQQMVFSMDYKMAIPLAPSQGLYLNAVKFDEYNKKCDKDNQSFKKLIFEQYDEGINKFIMNKILPTITKYEINTENDGINDNQFSFWLYSLDNHFKYEIIKITADLIQKLKAKGIEYVTAGNTHEPIDQFYMKIMQKVKENKKKKANLDKSVKNSTN